MKKLFLLYVCFLFAAFSCFADSSNASCLVNECPPGTEGITYVSKSEPYYACPTRELAAYTSFVLGIFSISSLTGKMPNISDKTGEPEFLDTSSGPNKTRLMIDHYRNQANVATFSEAVAECSKGIGKIKVVVLNNQKDDDVLWVENKKTKKTFWMPNSSLDKVK